MGRHGENIHKRRDGRWEARYPQFDPATGGVRYRSIYARSYQEAKQKRRDAVEQAHQLPQRVMANPATFRQLAEEWLASRRGW